MDFPFNIEFKALVTIVVNYSFHTFILDGILLQLTHCEIVFPSSVFGLGIETGDNSVGNRRSPGEVLLVIVDQLVLNAGGRVIPIHGLIIDNV